LPACDSGLPHVVAKDYKKKWIKCFFHSGFWNWGL
jgi:hypothetical protein